MQSEIANLVASPCPGAIGYLLRKVLFPRMLKRCGSGAQFGRELTLLHPHKMEIGDKVGIDDHCLLDARKIESGEFVIGNRVLIAREARIVATTSRGRISIGDHCMISRKCILTSTHGLTIGAAVAIGGMCIIGGGSRAEHPGDSSTMYQQDTPVPTVIEDDCVLGVGVRVVDGIRIGRGSLIATGAVIDRDIPEFSVVVGRERLEMKPLE